jgi:hypothetical protein
MALATLAVFVGLDICMIEFKGFSADEPSL